VGLAAADFSRRAGRQPVRPAGLGGPRGPDGRGRGTGRPDGAAGALAAGGAERAARTLRQALSLWQGPALADFRYEPFTQAEIVRLEELRLTCLEERIEADLALGLTGVLVGELRRLVCEHPVRERLRGQFMLALYRDGRQAEALEVYREFRSVLRDELGLEPSPQLRELETAILRQDSLPSPVSATTGEPLARRPVTVVCVLLRVASD